LERRRPVRHEHPFLLRARRPHVRAGAGARQRGAARARARAARAAPGVGPRRATSAGIAVGLALGGAGRAHAGPYTEPGYAPTVVSSWPAAVASTTRGPIDIANPGGGNASFGDPEYVRGPATGDVYDVCSLGDG